MGGCKCAYFFGVTTRHLSWWTGITRPFFFEKRYPSPPVFYVGWVEPIG